MRWIHVPIVLAIAGTGIAISLALQKQNTELFLPAILLHITSIPYMLLALWGLHVRTPALPSAELRKLDRLILCVVTKGKNVDVLLRTYRMLEPLCGNGVELCVVTDHPLPVPHLLVPPEFQTRHARYKARALEYFRQQQRFGPGDWVLHLDEESVVDSRTVAACQDYCRRSPYIYGQGLILYNNYEFWRHPLQTAADCIRVADDLGKFHLQLARIHWPIFGLHGSFLLVKGSLEDDITWDLQGSLVEDYAFALECMQRGLQVGEVGGVMREQSTLTIGDFLRQRRRWMVGIRGLSRMSKWARLWTALWSLSPLLRSAVVVCVLTGLGGSLPFRIVGICIAAVFLYLYLLGSVVQDIDRRTPLSGIIKHAILTALLLPVSYTLESAAVVWAIFSRERQIGFQIVQK